ncbi:hypothetical protein D3C87_855420 [compost metagenome]
MSANRLKHSQSGFTLIEVTLAIVIGVVVIAGATVLYNQAKNGAANSAAQSKVGAAASVVEEFAAKNFGTYPTATQIRNAWKRARPDDATNSPWGGLNGASGTDGLITGTAFGAVATALGEDATGARSGAIEYRVATNQATVSVYDLQTESGKTIRGYGVWIYNARGEGPNFVMGGK